MITIVGAGALGSHVALFLRNEEAGLQIVDFDRVEMKNTQAQFHTKMGMGRNKAVALQQAFQGMFGVKLELVPHKLTVDNADEILGPADLVIDCTDNLEARRVIREAVIGNDDPEMAEVWNIPCLHGALSADGTFGQVMWFEHFKPDEETGDGATCENGEHLPFFAKVSACLAEAAQTFLKTGKKKSYQITPSGILRVA